MKNRFFLILILSTIISGHHFLGLFSKNSFRILLSFSGMACSKDGRPSDSDGDGIADQSDNCPNHFNPRQTDEDQNNIGDLCEGLPTVLTCDELLQCESVDDCTPFIDAIIATCPNGQEFQGDVFVDCCDQRCTPADPMTGTCPAGTCASPGVHCTVEGDCPAEAPTCLEGCCVLHLCPNGESPPQCCPPGDVCDPPTFPPCPDGEICDVDRCCIIP